MDASQSTELLPVSSFLLFFVTLSCYTFLTSESIVHNALELSALLASK